MTSAKKIWEVLSPEQRRAAIGLLGLMLIAMALETLSTGAIIPALALMSRGDIATRYPRVVPVLRSLGNPSREHLVIASMVMLVGLYVVKALYLGFLAWFQARFSYAILASLSQRLFTGYLRQPYMFHLQRNSAQLVTFMGGVNILASVVQVGLALVTEVLVLVGISALLLAVEPMGAILVISTLGIAGWSFHGFTSRRIRRWGEVRFVHDTLTLQHLQQGLGGVKDVKLLGREREFLALHRSHVDSSARVAQRQFTLQALPRLWLELICVAGLAVLVIVMIEQGKPLEALIPTLGLFAAAAFRFMPSFNRALGAIQSIRYSSATIDALHGELRLVDGAPAPQKGPLLPFLSTLTLDGVTFQYESANVPALRDISLTIPCRSSVGFIGRSGAGKSTLVDVILGLLTPGSGAIRADGVDITTNLRGWQDQIGYVPQSIFLTDDTLRRNVAFGLSNEEIDEAAVLRAIDAAQLRDFVSALPLGLETVVGERGVRLSGGQRQRIGIARALYHDPQVLVLDEATSALDLATEREVMEAVRALHGDKTILIIAHRHSTVEHCDRLFQLEQGCVVEQVEQAVIHGAKTL